MANSENNNVNAPPLDRRLGPSFFFSLTIFAGAFLLFQVQPIIGKYILPSFGGGPEIWTTCMLFFQIFLLAGYGYAHFSISHFNKRTQVIIHVLLILAAIFTLTVLKNANFKPIGQMHPTLQIFALLALNIGFPYFVLSTTGPLIQAWFSRTNPGLSPYRLYSLSNAGSLIALVSFPFIFEPAFTRQQHIQLWSCGLIIYAVACICCAVLLWNSDKSCNDDEPTELSYELKSQPVGLGRRLLWIGLPAAASVELLAVTNKICLDIAVIPFLWILPLTLYLLSFIICFHSERWYRPGGYLFLFVLTIIGVIYADTNAISSNIVLQISIYSAMLFMCCLVCHGELYRLKPPAEKLTSFYLMIATGGALGGLFVAVIAPLLFYNYYELKIGIAATVIFVLLTNIVKSTSSGIGYKKYLKWIPIGLLIVIGIFINFESESEDIRNLAIERNFFGILSVFEEDMKRPLHRKRVMQHGTTFHGLQFQDPVKKSRPTGYYSQSSGVALAIQNLPKDGNKHIGVVGLGAGMMAVYGKTGDRVRFYEINPEVQRFAETYFTYLQSCPAQVDVIIGDARLMLEKEESQQFDILVLDAFSSDSPPVHLLTKQAFELYLKHVKPNGVIAINVTSRHLDLHLAVAKLADHLGLTYRWVKNLDYKEKGILTADWIILTKDESFWANKNIPETMFRQIKQEKRIRVWTDDHLSLFQILK